MLPSIRHPHGNVVKCYRSAEIAEAAYSKGNEGEDYSCAGELHCWKFSKQVCKCNDIFTEILSQFSRAFCRLNNIIIDTMKKGIGYLKCVFNGHLVF